MADDLKRIEAYLAALPDGQRQLLGQIRGTIRAAAPDANEVFGYGIPGFKQDGPLISYGAAKHHCAIYGQSPATQAAFAKDLEGYDTSKGTIRFTSEHPLPDGFIARFVTLRLAENQRKASERKAKKAARSTST